MKVALFFVALPIVAVLLFAFILEHGSVAAASEMTGTPITNSPAAGVSTTVYLPLVAAVGSTVPPTQPVPTELIVDGGFENGNPPTPWVQMSTHGTLINTQAARSGHYGALLGGASDTVDSIYQTVYLPVAMTLTYWHKVVSTDSIYQPYDHMQCVVRDGMGTL